MGGMWRFPMYTGLPGFDLTTSAGDSQVPLNSLHNVKTAVLTGKGPYGPGGGGGGTWSWDLGAPPWVS